MNYRILIFFFAIFFIQGCDVSNNKKINKINFELENRYENIGFALIYDVSIKNINEIEPRSLKIYHKFLKKKFFSKNFKS